MLQKNMQSQFIRGLAVVVLFVVGIAVGYFMNNDNPSANIPLNTHTMAEGYMMHDMDMAMDGMMMNLEGKTGAELEKAFLDDMIVHHQGAIDMAEALLVGTTRPELIKLANDIISAQTNEINMMAEWRTEWFGI